MGLGPSLSACLAFGLCLALCGVAGCTAKQDSQTSTTPVGASPSAPANPAPANASEPVPASGTPHVRIVTSLGDFVLELYPDKAPKTVENFLAYADSSFYDKTTFHRVILDFMAQGGGFDANGTHKAASQPQLENEADNGLENLKYTAAMARTAEPNSATSQFFINGADNAFLNHKDKTSGKTWGYCVFGTVVGGMETVDAILATPVKMNPAANDNKASAPITPVVIEKVSRLAPAEVAAAIQSCKVNGAAVAAALQAGETVLRAEERKAAMKEPKKVQKRSVDDQFQEAMQYLTSEHKLDVSKGAKTKSGLWVLDAQVGSGTNPAPKDSVEVHYSGWLTDGTSFDSSRSRGKSISFPLNGVIKGWTEGVGGMMPGGKRWLVIPPELAYGPAGRPSIPGNSVLIFEVELLSIAAK